MWTRFSSCTFMICLLSYHPLCLHSYSKLFLVAGGKACVGKIFVMHVHYSLAFLPTFVSLLQIYVFMVLRARHV